MSTILSSLINWCRNRCQPLSDSWFGNSDLKSNFSDVFTTSVRLPDRAAPAEPRAARVYRPAIAPFSWRFTSECGREDLRGGSTRDVNFALVGAICPRISPKRELIAAKISPEFLIRNLLSSVANLLYASSRRRLVRHEGERLMCEPTAVGRQPHIHIREIPRLEART
jgi:hypothetical protein